MSHRIVNVRDFRVGRLYVLPEDVVYIGRRARGLHASPFANPVKIGDQRWSHFEYDPPRRPIFHDRDSAVSEFYWWFRDAVLEGRLDPEPLRGKRLACWCAPLRCHGEVIVEWLASNPPLVVPGEPIQFGLHVQPVEHATTAPAWPPFAIVRRRQADRVRRAMR